MKIAGVDHAQLLAVYVKLSGPLSVSYLDVKGKDMKTGRALTERPER
jgi:hypothetical protein